MKTNEKALFCEVCKKEFYVEKRRISVARFCSLQCFNKTKKKQFCKYSHDTFICGRDKWNGRCNRCIEETIKAMRLLHVKSKKQICIHGHDTFVCGRNKSGRCKTCVSINEKHRRQTIISLDPKIIIKLCKNGHNMVVSGIDGGGRCSECRRIWHKEKSWKITGIIKSNCMPFKYSDYLEIFEQQNARCANKKCNKHQSEFDRVLAVDHDHKTGLFRGLLCGNCNTLLGAMKDNFILVEGLLEYLK